MYCIPLDSQLYTLSIDIFNDKINKWLLLKYAENRKILIFHIYFLKKHISLNIRFTCLKTAIHVSETHWEGRRSQNIDIGLSLKVIACRSGGFKKKYKEIAKVTCFLL